eukprot:CAMPEP_0181214574 /NCGR_PEP_ID=MMETSP1096-20121128/25533_1 /TAXON_ID=156174 ORGANISM="Chrysochromulina ericina, Strain CCMP281" /NCGR_SAMPLE_ID=MMETSP1096 /ASSEMBLY_ACC=CAM_ASM_000453 /LENGTH=171 /DNA_ID=CAMNT_0023306333 /DNA_START=132 /DNA_END=644 /DNA_ORIENTATION=-
MPPHCDFGVMSHRNRIQQLHSEFQYAESHQPPDSTSLSNSSCLPLSANPALSLSPQGTDSDDSHTRLIGSGWIDHVPSRFASGISSSSESSSSNVAAAVDEGCTAGATADVTGRIAGEALVVGAVGDGLGGSGLGGMLTVLGLAAAAAAATRWGAGAAGVAGADAADAADA